MNTDSTETLKIKTSRFDLEINWFTNPLCLYSASASEIRFKKNKKQAAGIREAPEEGLWSSLCREISTLTKGGPHWARYFVKNTDLKVWTNLTRRLTAARRTPHAPPPTRLPLIKNFWLQLSNQIPSPRPQSCSLVGCVISAPLGA